MVFIIKLLIIRIHIFDVEMSRLGEIMWFSLYQYSLLYSLYVYIEALQSAIHISITSLIYCIEIKSYLKLQLSCKSEFENRYSPKVITIPMKIKQL